MKFILVFWIFLVSFLVLATMHSDLTLRFPSPDAEVLASLLNSECSNCSDTEMYLVGSVVINRCESADFPNTVSEVILESGQFYTKKRFSPTEKTLKVANNLLKGVYVTPDIVYFCTKASIRPMKIIWVSGENHYFGK